MRTATGVIIFCLLAAQAALAQMPAACPGGRAVGGFQLAVEPPSGSAALATDALPLESINDLAPGDRLRYAPGNLPAAERGSARVALLLVPSADDFGAQPSVFTQPADRPALWDVPAPAGAAAFLFGPQGFDAKKTRALLIAHPELVAHFVQYATQASRVEALVALFANYEQSLPGSLDLDTLLKNYSAEYGVTMPKVNPTLSSDEEAAELLAAVAPPTAGTDPNPHAALAAGSTDTATALASLYFGPEVGIADSTVPLFQALHQTLFPGVEFQGAFAQSGPKGLSLCVADTAAPPQKHPVYIWMVNLPGGPPPAIRLAAQPPAKPDPTASPEGNASEITPSQATPSEVTLPAAWKSPLQVTCATVAQLHALLRARRWELTSAATSVPAPAPVPVPVQVSVSDVNDTLTLDLGKLKLPPGAYHLTAYWDWTPITVQGTLNLRAIPSLASAALAPGSEDRLIADNGVVPLGLAGADFSFVNKVELIAKDAAASPVTFDPPSPAGAKLLEAKLDTSKLLPGSYQLRLVQVNGGTQDVPVAIHPANPTLDKLPLEANLGEPSQQLTLHGAHLELIDRISSPDAIWKLAPVAASAPNLTQRDATVSLTAQAQPDQQFSLSLYVDGLQAPLVVADALRVLAPRPQIQNFTQSLAAAPAVALLPGELPADSTANFAFALDHISTDPTIQLHCLDPDQDRKPVTLHPGTPVGVQELDSGGDGLYYLALLPGQIGETGCQLQMTVSSPAGGDSDPYPLGRIIRLPQIDHFTLSDQSAGPDLYAGQLSGENLQLIAKTGWTPALGVPVAAMPLRSGAPATQTLAIVMPWPPPSPHAPLYIWLRGETQGRKTTATP